MPTKPPPLELEEFQIWLANPITERVLAHYRNRGSDQLERTQQLLLQSTNKPGAEWSQLQAQAAYLKGLSEGFIEVASVSFEDVQPEETE